MEVYGQGGIGIGPKNQQCLTVKAKIGDFRLEMRNKNDVGCGAASGNPPQAIRGHYRLLSDIQYIYIYPQILYHRGVFTTFRSLVSTGPWSIDTAEGQFRDDPDIRQYFKYRVCPLFLVSPVWIIFSFERVRTKRYFE